jgi:hypothetical protein
MVTGESYMSESRNFAIAVFVLTAIVVGILIISMIYYNRIRNGNSVSSGEATTMLILSGILLAFVFALWIWSLVVLFAPSPPPKMASPPQTIIVQRPPAQKTVVAAQPPPFTTATPTPQATTMTPPKVQATTMTPPAYTPPPRINADL